MSRENKPVRREGVPIKKKTPLKKENVVDDVNAGTDTTVKRNGKPVRQRKTGSDLKAKQNKKGMFARYADLWMKVHKPTIKEWFGIFWKVALIATVLGLFFMGFDYVVAEAVLWLQSTINFFSTSKTSAILYAVVLAITGLLSLATILLQRGNSDGLTSMFGSGFEYGGSSISGLANKIGKFNVMVTIIFVVLCLLSPTVFGGGAI